MHFHSAPRAPRSASPLAPLIAIAERGFPFTAADGQAFVRLPLPSGGFFILPVRSPAYRDWFFAAFFGDSGALPRSQAFATILNHLEAQANRDPANQRLSVFRRVGSRGPGILPSQILLDLANPDGQFVEISPSGWQVAAGLNALLQTSRSTVELPTPVSCPEDPAAPLETLRSCLNLPSRADWLRCLAWLLAAFRPSGPFPFLVLQGPPGAGKTFTARLLRALIDPSAAPLTPVPHDTCHLFSLARHNWVLAFDHISQLSPQLCDTCCRLSYGAGVSVREGAPSHTSREPLLQYCRRPMLFTVTGRWSAPPDFADRALTVSLPAISPAQRRSEAALLGIFSQSYPQILGALCTAVSTALARAAAIQLPEAPRFADALAWAMAAAPALGCTEPEMQQAFVPLSADPFVQSIQTLLAPRHQWTGTAAQLLKLLPPSPSYQTPKGLSQQLHRSAPALTASGIALKFARRPGGVRIIDLRQPRCDASLENPPNHASPSPDDPSQAIDPNGLITA
jgi:hypothetical protein